METLQQDSLFQDLNTEESAIVSGGATFDFTTYFDTTLVGLILGVPAATTQYVAFFKSIKQFV